jgi:NAD(P)-dependent dehydrogenase (short-subunit alcohol dehydrogenase family)
MGLTKTAALDCATKNIRVNAVNPGPIKTPLHAIAVAGVPDETIRNDIPMRRYGTTSEVAEAVLWLCSDAASHITGIALPIDGGATAM